MARLRTDFIRGTITNNPLAIGDTTITSAALASLPVVSSPDIAVLIIDPAASAPEVVHVTAHSAASSSATILRGREGSAARAHIQGTAFVHGATGDDFPSNAFPAAVANGDILYGVAASDEYVALAIGTSGQVLKTNAGATAPEWGAIDTSLPASIQSFIETGTHRTVGILGGAHNDSIANQEAMGIGFASIVDAGASINDAAAAAGLPRGGWNCSTGTTSGADVGFVGPQIYAEDDITIVWRGILNSAADQTFLMGLLPTTNPGTDANSIIAWRVSGTGNFIGVSDSAGIETTRDSGAAPNGTTQVTLRIEIRSGGTIVRFYRNNVQVGADVTTNIPVTTYLRPGAAMSTQAAAAKEFDTADLAYWMEV